VPLLVNSCATEQTYPRNALVNQILKPRPGYTGLTNRACEVWDVKNICTTWVIKEYILDEPTRKTLSGLDFICNISGHRYKVCLDKEGFCRTSYYGCGFLNMKQCKKEEYLPVSNYQFLLDANTKCFNKYAYPFD